MQSKKYHFLPAWHISKANTRMGEKMEAADRRIQRMLHKENGETVNAETELKRKYDKIFGGSIAEAIGVVNILTAYNDYKKLHDDLISRAGEWKHNIVGFTDSSTISDFTDYRSLKKACKREKLIPNNSYNLLSGMLKILEVFLCLLSIFQILYSLLTASSGTVLLSAVMFLSIGAILIPICLLSSSQKSSLFTALNAMDESSLLKLFNHISFKGSRLTGEQIYFVENFSKMDKLCRCYLITYFQRAGSFAQLWCVFDYLFENTGKLTEYNDHIYHDTYRLIPLNYAEKEALYYEFNLRRDINKEYLNCIGLDILWANQADVNVEFKFHSLSYIKDKILKVRNSLDPEGRMIKGFYCLVYMSAKYKYSFSVEQMVFLLRNKENAGPKLLELIRRAGSVLVIPEHYSDHDIRSFLKKMIEILDSYYFEETRISKGKKVRRYKFSYDILECFQKELENLYPDEESVKLWVLVKLLGNMGLFRQERYFYDCCNLLIMNETIETQDYITLSVQLLRMMNNSQCFIYYGPILERLYDIAAEEPGLRGVLHHEVIQTAADNYLFYVSDNLSIRLGRSILFDSQDEAEAIDWFSENNLSAIIKKDGAFSDYFKLLGQIFNQTIASNFDLAYTATDAAPSGCQEPLYLYPIVYEFCMLCLDIFYEPLCKENYLLRSGRLQKLLNQTPMCEESRVFNTIVMEMLHWIKSEVYLQEDRGIRNTNVGMLVETSHSNMLYFIYGMFNMIIVKDREAKFNNSNALLNFISRSFFYFNVLSKGEGITNYINDIINDNLPIRLKLNILISLLGLGVPCVSLIRSYILQDISTLSALATEKLGLLTGEEAIEKHLGTLLLYNANINSPDFTEQMMKDITRVLTDNPNCSGNTLLQFLRGILYNEWPEEEPADIINKVNQVKTPSFAIWILNSYCETRKEMLQRIPDIRHDILGNCSSNTGLILMARYLLTHSYYDSSHDILELYLETIKSFRCPAKTDIQDYLHIIDRYGSDNENFKLSEILTYNQMESLYLFLIVIEMNERQAEEQIYPQKTLEFIINLYTSLNNAGLRFINGNTILSSFNQNSMRQSPAIEKFIYSNFMDLKPIVTVGSERFLSWDYCAMALYILKFPALYKTLRKQASEYKTVVIRYKHILSLVNLLLEIAANDSLGFNLETLGNIKAILYDMYSIKQ